jgi:hypothetical protein
MKDITSLVERIRLAMTVAGLPGVDIEVKIYPDEIIFVAYAGDRDFPKAQAVANDFDVIFSKEGVSGFVAVRRKTSSGTERTASFGGLADVRTAELVGLLQSRSRTTEAQPSLSYVPDSAAGLAKATAARHHLIFGRRGAGKTALMLEGRRLLDKRGDLTIWMNLQPYRWQSYTRAAAATVELILNTAIGRYQVSTRRTSISLEAAQLSNQVQVLLAKRTVSKSALQALIPKLNEFLKRYALTEGAALYIFLDDFYFIARAEQAEFLDFLHSITRDANVWLKVASIQHLTHWFNPGSQVGMQVGHDADTIDLDATLRSPDRAQTFLERLLTTYCVEIGIDSPKRLMSLESLDRLVLASGSVPRDYLSLAASSILSATNRPNARLVGVQDINRAASDAADLKIHELDEDLGDEGGRAQRTHRALDILREEILIKQRFVFFRIDLRDRSAKPDQYELIASLMDARLIHLLSASVSAGHEVGRKSEAYLIDLSQYSAERLMRRLNLLEFKRKHLVLKEASGKILVGDDPRKLVALMRRAPQFELLLLESLG